MTLRMTVMTAKETKIAIITLPCDEFHDDQVWQSQQWLVCMTEKDI